ncbi:MAG: putative sulfate exporter family transporter [Deltaproteobacteria bacterium]|nr:putative sulfate exporter family transporter [Deltaproteobacteria bacterium]
MSIAMIPGYILMIVVAVISTYFSQLIEVGGKHPLEAAVIAIIIGVVLRNVKLLPETCEAGIKSFEKLLVLGIVLMGASLNFSTILSQGPKMLIIVLATMIVGFISIYLLSRMLKLSEKLSMLLAIGTTICGGTAIAVTAPLIKAKEEETSYAIGTIALWGLVAIILYPKVAQMLGVSDFAFGVFAGTAVHSTPQVVGAGFIFSELAGKTATAVKLVRNCFLAPMAFLITIWFAKTSKTETSNIDFKKAFPWFLFGYFVMAWFHTKGFFTPEGVTAFTKAGKFLVLVGMVGVGLNTRLDAFKSVGLKPLVAGLVGSVLVAACSIACINLLF